MGFNLNEYVIQGGKISALQTITTANDIEAVVSDSGELSGIWVTVDTDISADTPLTVFLNGSTATVTATVTDTQLADTGVYYTLSAKLPVTAGDLLTVQSGGEQVAATVAYVAFVVRR